MPAEDFNFVQLLSCILLQIILFIAIEIMKTRGEKEIPHSNLLRFPND